MDSTDAFAPLVPPRPRSAVSVSVGIAGLLGLIIWVLIAKNGAEIAAFFNVPDIVTGLGGQWTSKGPMDGPWSALMSLVWCAVPMVLWSVFVDRVHRNPTTGIDWDMPLRPIKDTLDISLAKVAGLWATWGAIALIYGLGRWYWSGSYLFAMELFEASAIPLLILSVPYVIWLDRRLVEPRDGAWHVGMWLMNQPGWRADEIYAHARSWAVKGFFIAFMFSIVPGSFGNVVRTPMADVLGNPVALVRWLISLMFVIDIAFATVGYVLTARPLDSHIRSANPFMAGWVAALICYPPFVLMGGDGPLNYHQGTADWVHWTAGYPALQIAWGGVLVVLTAIYAWATVAFGLRFSNLTNRGVLTHGPYAWTKHPAYLAKNAFWWLETLPFLVTSGATIDAVRNTVILGIISGVYFWRAKTEERHLGLEDPTYGAYARWMDDHGPVTRRINRMIGGKRSAGAGVSAQR